MFRPNRGGEVGVMMVAVVTCVMVLGLAFACVRAVRKLDNPPTMALICVTLGAGGAVGLTALPVAATSSANVGQALTVALVVSGVGAGLTWVWLSRPRGFVRPAFASETPAASPPQPQPDVRTYRVRSVAEPPAPPAQPTAQPAPRSSRVARIMEVQ